ncbi:hypothetical protein M426DRAFT_15701 [Hypoxylon sp. CI-4A]|nr:hypothetical protein M426DRAFT_15701 [Hypoxylon sp. CI-4A]
MSASGFSNLIAFQPVQGMGVGVIANKVLDDSDEIIREDPLMLVHATTPNPADFCEEYEKLSRTESGILHQLSCSQRSIEETQASSHKFEAWYQQKHGNSRSARFTATKQREIETLMDAYARFLTNAAGTWANNIGIYPNFSRLNHDCDPNAEWTFGDGNIRMRVQIIKKIYPGEQVTISYIKDIETMDVRTRQQELRNWGFTCVCQRCHNEMYGLDVKNLRIFRAEVPKVNPLDPLISSPKGAIPESIIGQAEDTVASLPDNPEAINSELQARIQLLTQQRRRGGK